MGEIPEPGNRAIVMWMRGGVPVGVYVRIDDFAAQRAAEGRWFNADHEQAGIEDHAWTWSALGLRFALFADGPYLLNVGELLKPGAGGEQ